MNPSPDQVLDELKSRGIVSPDGAALAAADAGPKRCHALDVLAENGVLGTEAALEALADLYDLTPLVLWKYKLTREVAETLPREMAAEKGVIAVDRVGDTLTVALSRPWRTGVTDEVKAVLGSVNPVFVLTSVADARDAVESCYSDKFEKELRDVLKKIEGPAVELVESRAEEGPAVDRSVLLSLTDQEPVVRLTNAILTEGVARKASDIFIEPGAEKLRIRYRVDGLLQEGPQPPRSMQHGVLSRLKIISELDIAEQRLPQDGRIKLRIENRWVEFRLSTLPSYYGEKACLRILDSSQVQLNLPLLGFDADSLVRIRKAASSPYGMILVCGPTGSGKTTTLYSVLKHVDGVEKNITTVEDPVEYHIDGLNQVSVRSEIGLTFAACLRAILRQDPNIILIGEIRDRETLDIAVKAALTGHLVLSTLHTNSSPGSITRLLNMGIEPFLITASVVLIGSQRLVRKLCDHCKEPFEPDAALVASLGLEGVELGGLCKPRGCGKCKSRGYAGRLAAAEILTMTPKMKELIMERAPEARIKSCAIREGMKTLRKNALDKALAGLTSLDEVLRVTARDDEQPKEK